MKQFIKNLLRSTHERLITVSISEAAIRNNLHIFQNTYSTPIAPVLKSNAYGHGLKEVGAIVDTEEIPFICVDTFFEALTLRKNGVKKPILIIGYTPLENILSHTLQDVSFAVISMEELRRLIDANISVSIHLKVDTGMHRHGIAPEELSTALSLIKESALTLDGVYSHLASADEETSDFNEIQTKIWNTLVKEVREAISSVRYFHLANSAGSAFSKDIDANVIRLGIGLYGINPGKDTLDLKPALEIITRITSIKKITHGEHIGYNTTFTASHDMTIATIPMGYNEGIDRRLSNKGMILVNDTECPILGRVSMNITTIDISAVSDIALDTPVTVLSSDTKQKNNAAHIATLCETIPYEILVHIPSMLHREVV